MTSTICLVRSGPTSWSEEGRLAGRRDLGLSAAGKARISALAEALGNIRWTEVVASPMRRAVQTAELLAPQGPSIARDGRLAPVDAGAFEGESFTALAENPDWIACQEERHELLLGSERLEDLVRRVSSSIEQARADNPDEARLLFVSHQWPIAAALVHYLDLPPAAVARFSIEHGAVCAICIDDITHRATVTALNWGGTSTSVLAP